MLQYLTTGIIYWEISILALLWHPHSPLLHALITGDVNLISVHPVACCLYICNCLAPVHTVVPRGTAQLVMIDKRMINLSKAEHTAISQQQARSSSPALCLLGPK